MKIPLNPASFFLFFASLAISQAQAAPIGFLEKFAISENREDALKGLIPGTREYYYYHALHAQNQGHAQELKRIIGLWIKRYGHSNQVKEIQNRQALLDFGKDPEKTYSHLKNELRPNFNHSRLIEGRKPSHPTKLDPAAISYDNFLNQAFRQYKNVQGVSDRGLEALDHDDLNADRLRHFLNRLQRPDIPSLPAFVAKDLKAKFTRGFGSHGIHRNMTKAQLDELLQLEPKLIDNSNFINVYLTKLAPSDDVDVTYDLEEKEKHLNRIYLFSQRLAPAHNSLKANAIYHILQLQRSRGEWNRQLFMEYLSLPRRGVYVNPKRWEEVLRKDRRIEVNLHADYRSFTGFDRIINDEPMVRSYFLKFFIKEQNYETFSKLIRDDYLKPLFAEAKLTSGSGDPEKWYSMLSAGSVNNLRERIDLDFPHDNKEFFGANEPVRLKLAVKNVETLLVKAFEINTFNHYTRNLRPVDTAINLDGLSATWERIIKYKESPMLRSERTFDFPELKKPGVYVVEFIGNGKSSRALVTKGNLRILEKVGPAGHELRIVDGNNAKRPKATLWLEGTEYSQNKEGIINIPFSNRPGKRDLVLRDGSFCALAQLDHLAESYKLDAAIHLDRESLVEGTTAKVILRPLLRLNGTPVSTDLLEEAKLVIHSSDHDGTPSMMEIDLPKFEQGKDLVHEFKVPKKLSTIRFELRTKVQNLSKAAKQTLRRDLTFTVSQMDRTLKPEALYLSQSAGEYFIEALGRNGEIVSDRALILEIKHLDFTNTRTLSLKTGQDGRIELGSMPGIEWVRARHPDGAAYNWPIDRDRAVRNVQPTAIHATTDEVIEVAVPGEPDKAAKSSVFSLLSKRKGFYERNYAPAGTIQGGYLFIRGLPPGDYELFLKRTRQTITLRITAGKRANGFVLSKNRILEDNRLNPIQIQAVAIENGKAKILVGNAGKLTRLHVYATRYISNWDTFSALDAGGAPSPYSMSLTRKRSLYVKERAIGEEYRYVLDRRYAVKYPGNMLKRPSLILNPWSVRKTETGRQNAAQGGEYASKMDKKESAKQAGRSRSSSARSETDYANLDFLEKNALLWANVKPNKDGVASIDLEGLSGHQRLHVFAVDAWNVAYRPVSLPPTGLRRKELRMAQAFDPDKPFSEQKLITTLAKGTELKIADVTTSKVQAYDSLARVYALLSTLSGDGNLAKFGFILDWPKFKEEEKRAKYSEFACHELNFFLHQKDPLFFKKVVQPYLANKKDKTFMDHWLLGSDLSPYLEPYPFSRLNAVEKILMARKQKDGNNAMARYVRELKDMILPNPEEYNRLFDSAIGNAAMETEDRLGLKEQQKKFHSVDKTVELMQRQPSIRNASKSFKNKSIAGQSRFYKDGYTDLPGSGGFGLEKAAEAKESNLFKLLGADKESEEMDLQGIGDLNGRRLSKGSKANRERNLDGFLDSRMEERKSIRQFYRKLPSTEEWAENNYYHFPIDQQNANLILVNAFWNDYASHPDGKPFVSGNFIHATRNFAEMMLALAVLDLPFEAGDHEVKNEGRAFSLKSDKPLVLFHQEIRATEDAKNARDILLSQNFYRADSRYVNDGGERLDNFVKEEFLKQIAYGCQVVITNPTSSVRKLRYLTQIPTGAMPLQNGFYSDGRPFRLEPYSTRTFDFYFYFPETGDFPIYPIQVASQKGRLAGGKSFVFKVVDKLSKRDETSWAWISQNGTEKEVIQYLRNHNMNRIALDKIAFRMRNKKEGGDGKDFFDQTLKLLSDRFAYDSTLWAYALYHKDDDRLKEYLSRSAMVTRCGLYLESPLLTLDPVQRGVHQHLEYKPLVNARAHQLGKDRKILNDRLSGQYRRYLDILKFHPKLGDENLLAVSYYLLLQDRVGEGLNFFGKVRRGEIAEELQYEYMATYADFYKGELASARQRASKYADYPVDRWQNLFREALAQLDEIDGKGIKPVDDEDREQVQDVLASSEPGLELEVEKGEISIHARNLKACTVNYYPMDVELLFSRKPFVKDDTEHFTSIVPNLSRKIALPKGNKVHSFPVPDEFADRNVMVEVVAAGIREAKAYYANDLKVQLIENYGQVQVAHSETGKPLPETYVKVYARLGNGQSRFYKDGYTDLRGRFDYASLNTGDLDDARDFSILVLHDRHGAAIREAKPPSR
jgi:hypothetical protein